MHLVTIKTYLCFIRRTHFIYLNKDWSNTLLILIPGELWSLCFTRKSWKQYMHFAEWTADRGQIQIWPLGGKSHPQFPVLCSDQYCGRMLNICHWTITHWWNKSMADRVEWDKAVCLLTLLLRDGEGKEEEREVRWGGKIEVDGDLWLSKG